MPATVAWADVVGVVAAAASVEVLLPAVTADGEVLVVAAGVSMFYDDGGDDDNDVVVGQLRFQALPRKRSLAKEILEEIVS